MPETEWRERLNKIEELNLDSAALLDRIERRAAERERERAERCAAQGAADISPEAMQATVKRWLEIADRFFQVLESELRKKRAGEPNG